MSEEVRSNVEVVVYALSILQGAKRKVNTEDIALEAFRLAPGRFSWVNHKEKPDKEVTRIALEDAAKEKSGALVDGKYAREATRDGWILTSAGIRWLAENGERVASALGQKDASVSQLSPTEVRRWRKRIHDDGAFRPFSAQRSLDGVTRYMFTDMLQCSPDAPSDVVRYKFERLLSLAEVVQDQEILRFLRECRTQFSELFEDDLEV